MKNLERIFSIFNGASLKTKRNILILLMILLLGLFLRFYQLEERFLYSHDQDLMGWFVRDVLYNKHPRLIGQETSTQGVFIGALFYYLAIPFYIVTGLDPIGGVILTALIGLFGIWSFYFCLSRIFNKKIGLVAAFVYAASFYTIFNDREAVPTTPVFVWSVWFFYALYLLLEGKQKWGLILSGILLSLIWHINFALILVVPLIFYAIYLSKKTIEKKSVILGTLALILGNIPLLLFELRHNFSQVRAIVTSLTTSQHDIVSGYEKFSRVIHLLSKNIYGIFMGSISWLTYEQLFYIFILVFSVLVLRNFVRKDMAKIMTAWLFLYVGFFSVYSKILSEYYLNGAMVLFIISFSVATAAFLENKNYRHFGYIILSVFTVFNMNKYFTLQVNESGYVQRSQIVSEIKRDARERGFSCIALSYITDPGYDLGYRYLFWRDNVHVTKPGSGAPVYTIVYPLKPIFPVHLTRGAIGLIYPNYEDYNKEDTEKACEGENVNITEPMFGFTN